MNDENLFWILTFQSGKAWLDSLHSTETKRIYLYRLRQYCDAVGKNPDELIDLKIDGLRNLATPEEFQAENLLNNCLYRSGFTESTKTALLCAVKSFYKANWRELNSNVGSNIEMPEPKKRSPKIQDILDLDDSLICHRDRAILWFLESAPLRQGTFTKLLWSDIKSTKVLLEEIREDAKGQISRTIQEDMEIAEKVPYYFVIESARLKGGGKGRYKGVRQIGFLHALAAQKLQKYKLELEERNIKATESSPIFVAYFHTYNTKKGNRLVYVNKIFDEASLIAWRDLEKKRFSPQDMRDILQSALENAKVNPNVAAPLLGHKVRGVDKHYSNHDIDEFLQAYLSALPWLLPQTVEEVKAETNFKIEREQKRLVSLEYENNDLKERINRMSSDSKQTKRELDLIKEQMKEVSLFLRIQKQKQDTKDIEEAEETLRERDAERQYAQI
jgi:hypothetical protein